MLPGERWQKFGDAMAKERLSEHEELDSENKSSGWAQASYNKNELMSPYTCTPNCESCEDLLFLD